jgi:hypothetical protein
VWILRVVIFLLVLVALAVGYFWAAMNWSYSSGERAGWVQKFSNKGWLCKTWEGELALVSMPGAAQEKFFFTVHDEAVATKLVANMGQRMSLHYEQKVGLPTTCFGETRYFVTNATLAENVPLGPGIVIPTAPAAATPPAPGAPAMVPSTAPGAAPAPAGAASR